METTYLAHVISGHPQSARRNSTSGGVRARVSHVASGEAIIRPSANATYDGTMRKLYSARRAAPVSPARSMKLHAANTGITAKPHTAVSTTTMVTAVTATRQAMAGRDGAGARGSGTAAFYV